MNFNISTDSFPNKDVYFVMNVIIPTTFLTHCVRVSIQIRANIIIFFINSIYNIKPLVNITKGFMLYIEMS
jgi:hypothetical protein